MAPVLHMTLPAFTALRQHLRTIATGEGLKARMIRGGLGSAGIEAASRLLGLVLAIVLARTLGAGGYGVYAYAFAIMSLLMVLAEAGVPTLLMREVAASQAREEWELLRGVMRRAGQFVALAASAVAIIGLLILWAVGNRLSPVMFHTIALMLLVLPLAAGAKTIAHALKGLHRVVLGQTVDLFLRPVLALALVAVAFLGWPEFREPYYAMAAQLMAAAIVLFVGLLVLRRLTPREARTLRPAYRSKDWLRSALPFTLIGGANVLHNQADIVMLGWFAGSGDVGIYRVAAQVSTLVLFSVQVVNAVVTPQISRLCAQGDIARLQNLVTQGARAILLVALPLSLVFILAGGVLISWVFGVEFTAAHAPLAVLAAGQLIVAMFGLTGPLLSMAGYERMISRAIWFSALLNVILNAMLIPLLGVLGAALSTVFTLALWHGFLAYMARVHMNIDCFPFKWRLAEGEK